MIVSLHVASGGLAGALLGSRAGAVAAGPLLHAVGDAIPHEDIDSMALEAAVGAALVLALIARHGPTSPIVVGALASSLPDAEHPFRPQGRKLFPSHRFRGWHRAGGVPVWAQLVVASVIMGALLRLARD